MSNMYYIPVILGGYMRLKLEENDSKSEHLRARCTIKQFYDIKKKAMLYCEGNMSEFMVYASTNYTPGRDELVNPLDWGATRPEKRGPNKKNRKK